jgi:hypothetical protein
MSTRSLVRLSLTTLAFALTVSGTAFARRPPALAQRQERTAEVLATCSEGARTTSGYRDMLARAEPKTSLPPTVRMAQKPALRKMGDHVVLLCPGGRVHGPGGYRDLDRRFNAESPEVQVAKAAPPGARSCM